jgi:hypothetical protein
MSNKLVLSLEIRRNDDGTWSVIENTRSGKRVVKAGFTSHADHADAKNFCDAKQPLAAGRVSQARH